MTKTVIRSPGLKSPVWQSRASATASAEDARDALVDGALGQADADAAGGAIPSLVVETVDTCRPPWNVTRMPPA